jgi:hypothetical protein
MSLSRAAASARERQARANSASSDAVSLRPRSSVDGSTRAESLCSMVSTAAVVVVNMSISFRKIRTVR